MHPAPDVVHHEVGEDYPEKPGDSASGCGFL